MVVAYTLSKVSYQMKIITTALFSVWMLNKSLNAMKWLSLILLTVGVALVQMPTSSTTTKERSSIEGFIGLVAVGIACVLSGLAGVW
jgi:drug/metabolite transporter (DMT)-like permease